METGSHVEYNSFGKRWLSLRSGLDKARVAFCVHFASMVILIGVILLPELFTGKMHLVIFPLPAIVFDQAQAQYLIPLVPWLCMYWP